jgi:hypothetical protein
MQPPRGPKPPPTRYGPATTGQPGERAPANPVGTAPPPTRYGVPAVQAKPALPRPAQGAVLQPMELRKRKAVVLEAPPVRKVGARTRSLSAPPRVNAPQAVKQQEPQLKKRKVGRKSRARDRHGNEILLGKRAECSWATGFATAWQLAHAGEACADADGSCSPDLQIDHKTPFYRLIDRFCSKTEVCVDGEHFDAYILKWHDEVIAQPVDLETTGRRCSVLRAYHLEANLVFRCGHHNSQKSGKRNPDNLADPDFLGECAQGEDCDW